MAEPGATNLGLMKKKALTIAAIIEVTAVVLCNIWYYTKAVTSIVYYHKCSHYSATIAAL